MPARVTLEVKRGPLLGRRFVFEEQDIFLFGRAEDCHARLPEDDIAISRHHFLLEVNPPFVRVRDLGSRNGTYVNEVKWGGRGSEAPLSPEELQFPPVDLKDGDCIRAGQTEFYVRIEELVPCRGCGLLLALSEVKSLSGDPGEALCTRCFSLGATPPLLKATPASRWCVQCGKNITAEVLLSEEPSVEADIVCRECQARAEGLSIEATPAVLEEVKALGLPAPPHIAGYEILKLLGAGGMGSVYLARRSADGQEVVIKMLLARMAAQEHNLRKFLREIEETRKLSHPNLVEFLDLGAVGSTFYFVMEYFPGGSVQDILQKRKSPLPLAEAGRIILDALEGLAYAHRNNVVHRDIKPQNILLTAPRNGRAKISDFGLAKDFQKAGLSGMTSLGEGSGTPLFMPREQLTNFRYVKPPSDVWSAAATLYHMLTLSYPYPFSRRLSPIQVILDNRVIPLAERAPYLPARLTEVVDRALAEEPEDRYQDAGEFYEALREVL